MLSRSGPSEKPEPSCDVPSVCPPKVLATPLLIAPSYTEAVGVSKSEKLVVSLPQQLNVARITELVAVWVKTTQESASYSVPSSMKTAKSPAEHVSAPVVPKSNV